MHCIQTVENLRQRVAYMNAYTLLTKACRNKIPNNIIRGKRRRIDAETYIYMSICGYILSVRLFSVDPDSNVSDGDWIGFVMSPCVCVFHIA